jgi:uncharacterized protein YfeS
MDEDSRFNTLEGEMTMRTGCQIGLAVVLAANAITASAADPIQLAFLESLTKHMPLSERKEWDTYVAREGVDGVAANYHASGVGLCNAMRSGASEEELSKEGCPLFRGLTPEQ